ncbi:MAG: DUF368 domain-containing protein, partial [Planctomycetales bacterium]|nr:DUF368 domain-containing protein [Planctomycetales bacterium]
AMILPGISGAYLLLILGFYPTLTDILHRLKDGDINFNDVKTVALFGLGCALGITGFSKILRWLLGNYHSPTLAVLCGFMIGALRRIWPFQLDLTPHTESLKLKHYENTWPTQWGAYEFQCVGVLLMGFAAVVILEWISVRRHQSPTPAA